MFGDFLNVHKQVQSMKKKKRTTTINPTPPSRSQRFNFYWDGRKWREWKQGQELPLAGGEEKEEGAGKERRRKN